MLYKLSIRALFVLLPCSLGGSLLLSGCGFQPLMKGDPDTQQDFELHVKGSGFDVYKFRREMEKHLATIPRQDDKTYVITVEVLSEHIARTFAQDATITRKDYTLTANCHIGIRTRDPLTKKSSIIPIKQTKVNMMSSYPVTPLDEFVSRTAEVAISTRTATLLAADLSREIMRVLKDKGNQVP